MAWERFSYICRKAIATFKDDEPISACLSRIQNEPNCQWYGKEISHDSISRKILDETSDVNDRQKAKLVLSLYSELDPSQYLTEAIKFKRIFMYLVWVAFVFYGVGAIYNIYVAPSFIEMFENFDITVPAGALIFHEYWWLVVWGVSAILVVSVVISFELKRLLQFKLDSENNMVFRYLVFKRVQKSYLRIITILYYPLSLAGSDRLLNSKQLEQEMIAHFNEVKDSNMDISIELQKLLKSETARLFDCCEYQIRAITTVVAVAIVSAIFFFLVSAYSPLFILGEVI